MRATTKFLPWLTMCLFGAAAPAWGEELWARVAGQQEIAAAFPARAQTEQVEGLVRLQCRASADGSLADCSVAEEAPADYGFGEAALAVAPLFRMTREAAARFAGGIRIPIRFVPTPPERPAAFKTMSAYRRYGAPGPYFPDRAARMGVGGEVVIDCGVSHLGRLGPCAFASENSSGLGFEDATVKMIQQGWMTAGPAPPGVAPPKDGVWRFRVEFKGRRR